MLHKIELGIVVLIVLLFLVYVAKLALSAKNIKKEIFGLNVGVEDIQKNVTYTQNGVNEIKMTLDEYSQTLKSAKEKLPKKNKNSLQAKLLKKLF